jgi:hypothetical protein
VLFWKVAEFYVAFSPVGFSIRLDFLAVAYRWNRLSLEDEPFFCPPQKPKSKAPPPQLQNAEVV